VQAETRYARSGDVSIPHQVVGDRPFHLVFMPGSISHAELAWTTSPWDAMFRQSLFRSESPVHRL